MRRLARALLSVLVAGFGYLGYLYATLPDVAASAEELIKAADTAMYRVKDAGKNGVLLAREPIA